MSEAQQKFDPAVEEVLASIRQIMADDMVEDSHEKKSDIIAFPTLSSSRRKTPIVEDDLDVLTLTDMVAQDGSVINLRQNGYLTSKAEIGQETELLVELQAAAEKESILELTEDKVAFSPVQELNVEEASQLSHHQTTSTQETAEPLLSHEESESIISPETAELSAAAFNDLGKLNDIMQSKIQLGTFGSQTVEELMRDLLRPLLKEWLDSHLPSLVKCLVAEKIEQILRERQGR